MNALVTPLTTLPSMLMDTLETPNRLPVKVDAAGRVWVAGKAQDCRAFLPACSRGELVFAPEDVCVLQGPWGPDPDMHLILSGRCARQTGRRLELVLDDGLSLQATHHLDACAVPTLTPMQRVWLSIPLQALQYCR
ncbi:hypothetical protein [Marinobacterium marinum]|uniref:Uncharacterized protein n=1 Tax=Marinobacterium marinum TaxID=2756129 RepID=A0A7W2A9X2_9GAMM|nr:hypothetical protein [Marinobacterium marinum]MBA4501221.1 hypothetical protein [Marinobacterium marinum]